MESLTSRPSLKGGLLSLNGLYARGVLFVFVAAACLRVGVLMVQAQTSGPAISWPTANQALQGQVSITGTTAAPNFASAELDFAYASDSTNTWFVIEILSQPVTDGTLANWDTTKVSDGSYVMRLRVFSTDGSFQDATVPFEVANYTAPSIASPTAVPTSPPIVEVPTAIVTPATPTPHPTAAPTPTPLPANPASMPAALVYEDLGRGALVAVAAIVVFAAILLRRRP